MVKQVESAVSDQGATITITQPAPLPLIGAGFFIN